MNRVSWSVEGIEPSVRERAEAAAKRAGMSLGDWISSQVGDAPPEYRYPATTTEPVRAPMADKDAVEVAEIHQRLDSITRQIEQISRPAARGEPAVARQLNDAISRLDARLSRITEPSAKAEPQAQTPAPPAPQPQTERVERAANQVYHASPPLNPASLDFAIAEIAARQSELDAPAPSMAPRPSRPRAAPAPPPPTPPPPPPPRPPRWFGSRRTLADEEPPRRANE
ncbi:hypothetical protein P3G22_21725, partial [Rhodopseudomonas sp. BAL398]|nr:hypothetical protein [Rhodopseudomonas sp. BAL398]